jgi:hypothetical protein
MINFYNQVPTVYNNASRDFQYLSWLINIVLNAVKHNIDDLYDLPNVQADPRLTELLALTLGFKVKRNYNQKQLTALVGIIPEILRYKGTKRAVDLSGKALIKASGVTGVFKSTLKDNCLEITLPEQLIDTILFMDLLPYILPAGITTRVVAKSDSEESLQTILDYSDIPVLDVAPELEWDDDNQKAKGLATLFEAGISAPAFTNFSDNNDDKILNAGLLDNNIIPSLVPTELSAIPLNDGFKYEEEVTSNEK